MSERIVDHQRAAVTVGCRIPCVAVLESQDSNIQRQWKAKDNPFAAVAQVAGIFARHVDARAVSRPESCKISDNHNVLTRIERINKLEMLRKWDEENDSVFDLPKLRNIKPKGKAKKSKDEDADAAAE